MNKVIFQALILLVTALPMLATKLLAAAKSPETKPNIVFIVVDDLGYGELGCYGGQQIPTPCIDAIAAGGAKFTNGYVTAPFCAASRAAILTARYQTRFGFEFNPTGAKNTVPGIGLPVDEKTIADRLRDAGYATGVVGKWHLGGTAEFHPQRRGFDEFFGFLHEGHYYVQPPWNGVTTWLRRRTLPNGGKGIWTSADGRIVWSTHLNNNEHEYDTDNPLIRSSQPVDERENLTDAFTREACHYIRRHRDQPFFLYLAYNAVHSPMQGADEYLQRFSHIENIQRRIFAAMLAHLDESVGKVLNQLNESGVADNTLVVFLSDNGGPTKELTSSNAPLRGSKGELWEGGIRVPFIVSWKNRIPVNRTIDTPITSMDATVTAMEIAGVTSTRLKLDGKSLLPLMDGKASEFDARNLFWRVGSKNAIRNGDWKLIRDGQEWQLYNLSSDVGETTNLAEKESVRLKQMSEHWDRWNAEQIEPRWR